MKTTLKKIKDNDPCQENWDNLLAALGKTEPDDEPIELSFILQSNDYYDALWALRTVDGYEKEIRLFAVFCARQVQHLMTDERSINAIDVAERFANGEATESDLAAARESAMAAAMVSAMEAAMAAAMESAMAAAMEAAWFSMVAAMEAAMAAAMAAARAENKNNEPEITTAIHEEFKKLISL